jgi:DNA (cytosine-5)-methyltransferase 1
MQRAGFHVVAAIDVDPVAIATLRANLVEQGHPDLLPVTHALERDLTRFTPAELASLIGTDRVDVIVGGPPCQGFSKVRRVDGTNNGPRLVHDARRLLYSEFLRYLEYFQPRVFVMENVPELRSAVGGAFFTAVQKEARDVGYRVHAQLEDAWELGVPQKRRRRLIIGVRTDIPGYFPPKTPPAPRALPKLTLGVAIEDLPILRAGGGSPESEYSLALREKHLRDHSLARAFLYEVLEVDRAARLTNHTARSHSDRDLRDFDRLNEGESSAVAMRNRGVVFEYPYDKSTFKDRYTRQSRVKPCSTIVAHLSKDGLMFIHPTQRRSLTPREAARVQTFPDWFRFPAARTSAFRLIGNAVPPLVAEAVGLVVRDFLGSAGGPPAPALRSARGRTGNLPVASGDPPDEMPPVHRASNHRGPAVRLPIAPGGSPGATGRWPVLPRTRVAAAHELERLARLDRRALRALSDEEFLAGWHALLFLFPGLHPDNALDHGHNIEDLPANQLALPGFEHLLARRYARSGWPVALELIGHEAWWRYEHRAITEEEFYCVTAQRAGLEPEPSRERAESEGIKE